MCALEQTPFPMIGTITTFVVYCELYEIMVAHIGRHVYISHTHTHTTGYQLVMAILSYDDSINDTSSQYPH